MVSNSLLRVGEDNKQVSTGDPLLGERSDSKSKRGELRVYLGAAPGVGTTYAMLGEAHRRLERAIDVGLHGLDDVQERVAFAAPGVRSAAPFAVKRLALCGERLADVGWSAVPMSSRQWLNRMAARRPPT